MNPFTHKTSELSADYDAQGYAGGGFRDVARACSEWLEKRGLWGGSMPVTRSVAEGRSGLPLYNAKRRITAKSAENAERKAV